MPTRLVFLRHATAQDRFLPIADAKRKLLEKGIKQSQRVARFCEHNALCPEHLLSSPLARAQETASVFHKQLSNCPKPKTVAWLANQGDKALCDAVEELAAQGMDNIWLVGHEPDFSAAISRLLGKQETVLKVKKASLVALDVDFQQRDNSQLLWSIPCSMMKLKR